jgi:hypothetical protein
VVEDVVKGGDDLRRRHGLGGAATLSGSRWATGAMQLEDVEVAAAAILRSVDKVRAG